ncbi:MAG: LCP family protein [Bacilli bacterium]
MNNQRNQAERLRRRFWRRAALITAGILLLGGIIVGAQMLLNVAGIFGGDENKDHTKIDEKKPLTVLLLGVDERKDDPGRADTIIVATVNPEMKSTKLVSIPRDTVVQFEGMDFEGKINETYSRGNLDITIKTVEKWVDMPIDYYVKINMEGLQDLIDAVGGVEVDNPFAWSDKGWSYPEGRIHIEGKRAVWFVRMRKLDPEGDFGRQKRQQMVIRALADKLTSPTTVIRLPDILGSLQKNVETDVPFSRVVNLTRDYMGAGEYVEQLRVEGTDERLGDLWIFVPDVASQSKIQTQLKDHLEGKELESPDSVQAAD